MWEINSFHFPNSAVTYDSSPFTLSSPTPSASVLLQACLLQMGEDSKLLQMGEDSKCHPAYSLAQSYDHTFQVNSQIHTLSHGGMQIPLLFLHRNSIYDLSDCFCSRIVFLKNVYGRFLLFRLCLQTDRQTNRPWFLKSATLRTSQLFAILGPFSIESLLHSNIRHPRVPLIFKKTNRHQ